jgi:predicted type IV restriction endonuclease
MTEPTKNSAEFVTGFATGWPEDKPDLMILSFTTANGRKDFAVSKDQALLIAKTVKRTAAQLATSVSQKS